MKRYNRTMPRALGRLRLRSPPWKLRQLRCKSPRKIITKDNVSIDIAAVAYYHISDPEKAVIVIENAYNAINQISQTTVRCCWTI